MPGSAPTSCGERPTREAGEEKAAPEDGLKVGCRVKESAWWSAPIHAAFSIPENAADG